MKNEHHCDDAKHFRQSNRHISSSETMSYVSGLCTKFLPAPHHISVCSTAGADDGASAEEAAIILHQQL